MLEEKINEKKKTLKKLFEAATENKSDEIKAILLSKPELISYKIPLAKFKTVFHLAAVNDNFELFEYLHAIEPRGIHFEDKYSMTPLFYVANSNNLNFLKKLIEWGANIEHIDRKNASILYGSIAFSKTFITEYILSHKVNVNVQSEMGRSPLIKAGQLKILSLQKEKNQNSSESP